MAKVINDTIMDTHIVQEHKLIELGFERYVYEDQKNKPLFYKIQSGNIVAEISEDYKVAQWCDDDAGDYEVYNMKDITELNEFVQYVLKVFRVDIGA